MVRTRHDIGQTLVDMGDEPNSHPENQQPTLLGTLGSIALRSEPRRPTPLHRV
jgi:hypothetical protein